VGLNVRGIRDDAGKLARVRKEVIRQNELGAAWRRALRLRKCIRVALYANEFCAAVKMVALVQEASKPGSGI